MIDLVTIHDVAREAEVSLATVSRVVNNSLVVSAATRQKVQAAIEKLGYQAPGRSGAGIKKQVLLISDVSDPEGSNSLYQALSAQGYQMFVFYNCERKEPDADLLQFLKQQNNVAGIILQNFIRPVGEDLFSALNAYPIVQYETRLPFDNSVTLGINHFQAAYDAAEHLLSLGCRRIAFMGSFSDIPTDSGTPRTLFNGYRSALLDGDLMPDPALMIECDFTVEGAYEGLRNFLASGKHADGLIVPLDTMALGGLRALQEAGLNVPGDMKLISLMGMWCSAFTTPSISSLDQPSEAISQEAARLIALLISGEPGAGRRISIPHSFTYRESTGEN